MHEYDWKWDTMQNIEVPVIIVYDTIADPKAYGWAGYKQYLTQALSIWERDLRIFAFRLQDAEAIPAWATRAGTIQIVASDREGPWWGFTNNWIGWESNENTVAEIEISTERFKPPEGSDIMRRLLVHEIGHVLGLGHRTDTSVMNPNLATPRPDEHDLETLRGLYLAS